MGEAEVCPAMCVPHQEAVSGDVVFTSVTSNFGDLVDSLSVHSYGSSSSSSDEEAIPLLIDIDDRPKRGSFSKMPFGPFKKMQEEREAKEKAEREAKAKEAEEERLRAEEEKRLEEERLKKEEEERLKL